MFRLLSHFGKVKNNNALLLYQSIVFAMKENINNLERREFFYHNFLEIFDEDENIPVHILIEPLI